MSAGTAPGNDPDEEFERLVALANRAEGRPELWPEVANGWVTYLDSRVSEHGESRTRGALGLSVACLRLFEATGLERWARLGDATLTDLIAWAGQVGDAPLKARAQHNLAFLSSLRYERSGEPEYAEAAERQFAAALTGLHSAEDRAVVQHTIGSLLLTRYERTGDPALAVRAEERFLSALDGLPRGSPDRRAIAHYSLGCLYLALYERAGDASRYSRARDHFLRALKRFGRGHADAQRAAVEHSLGRLYGRRHEHTGREVDALRAERHYTAASRVYERRSSPRQWATIQHSLGALNARRYERSGDPSHAAAAEDAYRRALEVWRRRSSINAWVMAQHSLGSLYRMQYEQGGDELHARRAAVHLERALAARRLAPSATGAAMLHHSLGHLFRARYERTDDARDSRRALRHYRRALKVYRRDETEALWATLQHSLASLLLTRVQRTGDPKLAREAEQHYRAALTATDRRATPSNWALIQHGMGALRLSRYQRSGREEDFIVAERCCRDALQEIERGTSLADWALVQLTLGQVHQARVDRGSVEADSAEGRRCYRAVLRTRGTGLLPETLVFRAAAGLIRLAFGAGLWREVATAYEQATASLGTLYRLQLGRESKTSWLTEAQGLAQQAAYALLRQGRVEEAAGVLEKGRARVMADTLARERVDLEALETSAPELARRYTELLSVLARLDAGRAGDPPRAAARRAERIRHVETALEELVGEVRRVPGYADFLAGPGLDAVRAASSAQALAYLAATPRGGFCVLMTPGAAPYALAMPRLSSSAIAKVLWGRTGLITTQAAWRSDEAGAQSRRESTLAAIDSTARWLWDVLVGSLLAALRAAGVARVTLIPTGALGVLPIHAAWRPEPTSTDGRRYALEEATFSYAASAYAFSLASERARGAEARRLLLVADPQPTSGDQLPFVEHEAAAVCRYWPIECSATEGSGPCRTTRWRAAATADQVAELAPHHEVLHFAGHAFGPGSRSAGGLVLADDHVLGPQALYSMRLQLRLAVLSACETGRIDLRHADEVVALPAALAEAGAAGVVASLWHVADRSTAFLMDDFYDEWRNKGLEPAEALRRAQLRARRSAEHRHPYHWGAFTCWGT